MSCKRECPKLGRAGRKEPFCRLGAQARLAGLSVRVRLRTRGCYDCEQRAKAHCQAGSGRSFQVHPHMLRHACGFKLANDGQDTRAIQHYMVHKNIMHTVRYTELAPDRFKQFFRD